MLRTYPILSLLLTAACKREQAPEAPSAEAHAAESEAAAALAVNNADTEAAGKGAKR